MPNTRANKKASSNIQQQQKTQSKKRKTKQPTNSNSGVLDDGGDGNEQQEATQSNTNTDTQQEKVFKSRFPEFDLDNYEERRPSWSIVKLREAIAKQDSRRSTAHKYIKDLVKIIRMDFEKTILMVALMAGVPEVVIWTLVGLGSKKAKGNPWIRFLAFCVKCLGDKLPDRDNKDGWVDRNQDMAKEWRKMSDDKRKVFTDPFFFALAGLPDYSKAMEEATNSDANDEADGVNVQYCDEPTKAPQVHQLSDEEKQKYQPLFDKLVNVDKLHLSHGKPEPTASVATLQKRSLLAVRKAHQDFAVICQQNHISYYLTTASCGGVEGWSQTFSNNIDFAKWALTKVHVPTTFTNYVHGKDAAQTVEKKAVQPSDERKSRLCSLLNGLISAQVPEEDTFPKNFDPATTLMKRWNLRIVQKPGSVLTSEALKTGHRKATDAVIRAWTKDIENYNFVLEKIKITEAEQEDSELGNRDEPQPERDNSQANQSNSQAVKRSTAKPHGKSHKKRVIRDSDDEDDTIEEHSEEDSEDEQDLSTGI